VTSTPLGKARFRYLPEKATLVAFATDLVLADNAAANKTFSLRKTDGFNTERIDQSTTAGEPRLCTIKHSAQGKKGTVEAADRHLISFATTKKDATTGVLYTATLNATLVIPQSGPLVRADFDHLIAFAKNFLITANVDKWVRSES